MEPKAIFAIIYVLVGCGLNNIFLEYLVRREPGSGHLITFCQFLFIALIGFVTTAKCGTVKPKIAMNNYFVLVFFFFLTSVLNNWAFDFNIPVPLHMIFRSGSLIANMIMGIWILKKRYTSSKYISVAMITAGIIICTFISSKGAKIVDCPNCQDGKLPEADITAANDDFFYWVLGIIILTTALFLSARMGIFQEQLYKEFGKHPDEALFYTHLLSLPGFLMYYQSISKNANIVMESESFEVPVIGIVVPLLFFYLVLNVITQYLCINYVYVLTTECTSLTVTLVITLRKFFSLILSIVYFDNPFTLGHWIGTLLVFIGTLIFTEVFSNIKKSFSSTKEKSS